MIAFRGKKKPLGHAHMGLLWGFISKFQTSIPAFFIWESPQANITFAQLNLNLPEHNIPARENTLIEKSSSLVRGKGRLLATDPN